MIKKSISVFIVIVASLLTLGFCYPEEQNEQYVLKPSFHFCTGFGKIYDIKSIEFTNNRPSVYEKKWNPGVAEDSKLEAYRVGNDLVIFGEKIILNPNSSAMFAKYSSTGMDLLSGLKEIKGLELLDSSLCKDMSRMFYYDDFLVNLDKISSWDMSEVEDMSFMFSGCTELIEADIGAWDVEKVQNFSAMFQGKQSNSGDMNLQHINVSNWNTASAINMGHMFYGCSKLHSLDLSNWDVSKVETFTHTFADCYELEEIDLCGWNTESVISFDAMFNDCQNLTILDLSTFRTENAEQFSQMFEFCKRLTEIKGIENWNVSKAQYYAFSETFSGCSELKNLDLSNWYAPNADNTARMFKNCKSLKELDLNGFSIENIKHTKEMFDGCEGLQKIYFSQTENK